MKRFKLFVARCLVVVSMLAPWAGVEARETFEDSAYITWRDAVSFETRDRKYRISSQLEVFSNDPKKQRFTDLRKGDGVYFKGEVVNGQYYVYQIYYEIPEES